MSICCTAIEGTQEQTELERMVQELGGVLVQQKNEPQIFVATSVAKTSSAPIVRPTWLRACHSAGRKVPLNGHELGTFEGLTISTSGHNAAEKENLGRTIQQGRGVYSKNMTKACTHLVIKQCNGPRTISEKERHAHLWGTIQVVWDSWLQQTAQNGVYLANEEHFLVPGSEPAKIEAQLKAPVQQKSHGVRQHFVAGPPSETFTFLDGLRVFLACCASNEIMELACICREGGACRYPLLNPLITHIVVGSDLMVDELQCIRQHQQKHGALVRVLDAGWLRQCGTSRAHEDEEAWLFNPASALAAGPRKSREGSDLLDNREGSRVGFQAASSCEGDASRHGRSQAASGRGPLGDCWFTLAALEHEPGERARVHELIRQAGGRIFDAKRINLVASTSSTYAVCPLGFPPPRLAEVMRQTDFKMVPDFNRITPYWVELSIDCGAPVKQLGRDRVTCKPLPFQLPMPGMANVKLCASGMADDAKNAIKELVKHLGGKYTQRMTRSNTHLIIQKAMGEKWKHARAYDVKPVTPDWLVDSALAGVLLPESRFAPPAPAPGEEELNAATQFPFEMTARPAATQHRPQAAPAFTAGGATRADPDALNDSSTAPSRASTAVKRSSDPQQDDMLLQRMMSHASTSDHGQRSGMVEAALWTKAASLKRSTAPHPGLQEALPTAGGPDKGAACDPLEAMIDAGSRAGPDPPEDVAAGAGLLSARRGKHKSRLRNMQAISRPEPSDDQENVGAELMLPAENNSSQPGDAGNKAAEWTLAAARLGNFLEAVAPPNLASSQQDAFAHPAQRASSAGSGRQGGSVAHLQGGLSSMPGEASAGEAMSMHSGDSTGLSHGASNLRKRGRGGAAGGAASSGTAPKRPSRATSAASADANAPAHFDCSQQVGYGGAGRVPPAVTTRRRAALNAKSGLGAEGKGSEELAKQRLARAVRSSVRRDAGKNEDALKAMGLMD
ncbi:hypothetical protein WJX75_004882 [Coccomyxa subellipsoidea]|uniref:BRCT domain-containing protein n=1 Tax=Coccomyxa subellipsoidea TaxID=248742 RepID=A0ABR2YHQ7_9CHLO